MCNHSANSCIYFTNSLTMKITEIMHLWAQLWALARLVRFFNEELHIQILRNRLIIYAICEVTNPQNVTNWN